MVDGLMALDLKKKLGPLPTWAWAVGGLGTIGIIYYLHKSSSSATSTTASSSGIDPATGVSYATEEAAYQAAQSSAAGLPSAGDTSSGSLGDTTGLATGATTTDQLAQDLGTIQTELSTLSLQAPVDAAPSATIASEAQDLLAARSALNSLGLGSTTNGATAAAKGKTSSLSIRAQLEDLVAGKTPPGGLSQNAAKRVAAANGNAAKALAALKAQPKKKTRHTAGNPGIG